MAWVKNKKAGVGSNSQDVTFLFDSSCTTGVPMLRKRRRCQLTSQGLQCNLQIHRSLLRVTVTAGGVHQFKMPVEMHDVRHVQ
jgi:hypothetical protein